ncbi:MAG: hypothetical protein LKJ50_04600 [Clostridiales bacterium]|jgi:hypothetical protein|nr:hypothetical protein [Clostridiales bacterium]MCI1961219.1 hypothetical protein [Clostridiales bacterium]MCI2021660.1 hypothetical protein [Clostridiales bacterium]MCI2026446.1 hypothetical protein [Clostridiales bacterium]
MTAIYNIGLLTIILLVASVIIWAVRKAWSDYKQEINKAWSVIIGRRSAIVRESSKTGKVCTPENIIKGGHPKMDMSGYDYHPVDGNPKNGFYAVPLGRGEYKWDGSKIVKKEEKGNEK